MVPHSDNLSKHTTQLSNDFRKFVTRHILLALLLITDEFKGYVPEWMQNKIRCNMVILKEWCWVVVKRRNINAAGMELNVLYDQYLKQSTIAARDFHYKVIVAITQQCTDEVAMKAYLTVMGSIPKTLMFLSTIAKVGGLCSMK